MSSPSPSNKNMKIYIWLDMKILRDVLLNTVKTYPTN